MERISGRKEITSVEESYGEIVDAEYVDIIADSNKLYDVYGVGSW